MANRLVPFVSLLGAACLLAPRLLAADQLPDVHAEPAGSADAEGPRLIPLVDGWSWHAQTTIIMQHHDAFTSPYAGTNSLSSDSDTEHTWTVTGFLGRHLWAGADAYIDPEEAQGIGFNDTTGIAGFPNGEATRAASSNPHYYLARWFLRQTIGLGGGSVAIPDDKNQVAGQQDRNRLVITCGKMSATDIFDANSYSHDSRSQFMNWALMDTGAWDYPADARGYTQGLVVEWIMPRAALRLGSFMEPKSANQLQLDGDVRRAHGDTAELELDYALGDAAGITRILAFDNHAHMGSYAATLADPALQNDIAATRVYRSKYGCALNCEQALTGWAGAFLRAGWNDGHSETWAFTEIDQSLACGVSIQGTPWGRPDDVLGLAGLVNGLSQEHRAYLAAGGYGFIIGDGRLTYAPEDIIEAYASVRVCPAVTVSLDYQYVTNPAYNHDRGPVSIIGVRGHIEL